jgi:hypothetical protein
MKNIRGFQFSVRTVLAITFGGTGAGVLGYLAVHGNRDCLLALVAIASSVISFYFGGQSVLNALGRKGH